MTLKQAAIGGMSAEHLPRLPGRRCPREAGRFGWAQERRSPATA